MRNYIDTAELAKLYADEVMLEELRKRGKFPTRVLPMHNAPADKVAKLRELFKDPKDYGLRERLAAGRYGERARNPPL